MTQLSVDVKVAIVFYRKFKSYFVFLLTSDYVRDSLLPMGFSPEYDLERLMDSFSINRT